MSQETRAEIDHTTVRALLVMNGGGAVAVLTFLGSVLSEPGMMPLVQWGFLGLLLFQLGLLAAVVHNHLRRRCNLAYETGKVTSDTGICFWSTACMIASIGLFFLAGLAVAFGGYRVVGSPLW